MTIQSLPLNQWKKLYLPEATCAFGAPYCIHVRRGDPRRLVFYLEGGGVSWDRESAKWPGTAETREVFGHVGLYSTTADGESRVTDPSERCSRMAPPRFAGDILSTVSGIIPQNRPR